MDLYTTDLAVTNFKEQEQNLIVKIFDLNQDMFFMIEIVLAIILILVYLFSIANEDKFIIKSRNLNDYIKCFLFNKINLRFNDYFHPLLLRNCIVLYGSIIPVFVISTSLLFCLNNFWVYLNINNNIAFEYYVLLDDFYFFDVIIFIVPPTLLLFLLFKKLKMKYLSYNDL